jgi:LPXTG-motif cell wall-anchored protein
VSPPVLRLAGLLVATPASASEGPFLRLEAADATRCASDGLVSVRAVEVLLDGSLAGAPASEYRLVVDGAIGSEPPLASTIFRESTVPLEIGIAVQANLAYRIDMAAIVAGLGSFLGALPPRAIVSVVKFGDGVHRLATRRSPKEAAEAVAGLSASDLASAPAVDAFRTTLLDLGEQPDARKMLIIVSDGLSTGSDRDAFRALGDLARAKGVAIHPIAYSATDERAPLLALGEIAKRSNGTFRWATKIDAVGGQLERLAAEIDGQMLLDFAVADRCVASHAIAVARGALRSNTKGTRGSGDGTSWLGPALGLFALAAGGAAVLGRRKKQN